MSAVLLSSTYGLDLQVLHAWGYWIDGKFLMNHLCLLPAVLLLSFSRKFMSILQLLAFREIAFSSLLEGLPYTLDVVTQIKMLEVSMKL